AVTLGDGGECHDVIQMYRKYGALPQSVYSGLNYGTKVNDFSEMAAIQKAVLDAVVNSKGSLTPNWLDAYTAVIDAYSGTPPATFTRAGRSYTPQSLAEQVVGLDAAHYVELSSFRAFPMCEPFLLPVPDT